jgi:RNA polymerase sigma-70 factor (ECF subfamily)
MTGPLPADRLTAFEELYAAHGPRLKSIACNLLRSPARAEDAVQETFLKAFRSWDRFKGDAAEFTWLYRILVNTCLDEGRRTKRRREEPEPGPEEGAAPLPLVVADDHPLRLALEKALGQIHHRARAVFVLAEVEGFTHREIGEILDIPEGTSKHALFEAKLGLRRLLRGVESPVVAGRAS